MSVYITNHRPRHADISIVDLEFCLDIRFISAKARQWARKYMNYDSKDAYTLWALEDDQIAAIEGFKELGFVLWFNPPLPPNPLQQQIGSGLKFQHILRQHQRYRAGEIDYHEMRANCFPELYT